jgi:hypothetical protein
MQVVGDYQKNGFALVRELIPEDVARAFMKGLKDEFGESAIQLSTPREYPAVLRRAAFEFDGDAYKPMKYFLWALTPTVSQLVGKDLLPTYGYFRVYRGGDICRVHSDRPESEHSVSLTLDYSDGEVWDLQIGHERIDSLHPLADDFGSQEYTSLGMKIGDAALYQGHHYAHGRMTPNPNRWSAHLFLNFVDRDGSKSDRAFDRGGAFEKVDFKFV